MEAEGFGVFFDVVYFHVEDFLFVLVEKFAPRVCVDDLVEWGVVEFVLLVVGEERVCLGHYFISFNNVLVIEIIVKIFDDVDGQIVNEGIFVLLEFD